MSIENIEFIEQQISLLDKSLTIRVSDTNLFEHYFDTSELESAWHTKTIGVYHFSQLIRCLRAYYWNFKLEIENSSIEKGIFLMGKIIHELIQTNLEKRYGFSIIERPILDECEKFDIIGKVDIIDILEHRLSDIKTTSWLPIFVDFDFGGFEEKYGLYLLQILAYAYFLNNTYFTIDPLEVLRIILVDKKTLETKVMEIDYDEALGQHFYLKIRARAEALHNALTNATDWVDLPYHLDKNCKNCIFAEEIYCPEGYKLKLKLTTPETPESIEFKRKFGMNKKPFWKYSDETESWIKSKEFVKFLQEEKGYSDEEIKECGW